MGIEGRGENCPKRPSVLGNSMTIESAKVCNFHCQVFFVVIFKGPF